VDHVHSAWDGMVHWSTVDKAVAQAARLAGVVRTADSGHGCSPQGLLEEKGLRGTAPGVEDSRGAVRNGRR
jgi:hypothetical protein